VHCKCSGRQKLPLAHFCHLNHVRIHNGRRRHRHPQQDSAPVLFGSLGQDPPRLALNWMAHWLKAGAAPSKTENSKYQKNKHINDFASGFQWYYRWYPHYGPNLANMARNPRHSSNNLWLSPLHPVSGFGKWCHPVVKITKFPISITIYYVILIYRHTYKWLTRRSFRYEYTSPKLIFEEATGFHRTIRGPFLLIFSTHSNGSPSIASKIHAFNKERYEVKKRVIKYLL